jgi:ArsR family transcriptional regulator
MTVVPKKRVVKLARLTNIKVSDHAVDRLSDIFKLLADRSRLKILLALAGRGEMHVSALCQLLEQSQPAVSHHLTLLRMSNLVGCRREGKHNYYRLDSPVVSELLEQFFSESGNGRKLLSMSEGKGPM